jgi:hypothetical protein
MSWARVERLDSDQEKLIEVGGQLAIQKIKTANGDSPVA